DACGTSGPKRREPAEPGGKGPDSPKAKWDKRAKKARTGRTGQKSSRQCESSWDKGTGGTRKGGSAEGKENRTVSGTVGTKRPELAGSTEMGTNSLKQIGTSGTEVRGGRGKPGSAGKKNFRNNSLGQMGQMDANRPVRLKSAQGARSIWDIRDETAQGRERAGRPVDQPYHDTCPHKRKVRKSKGRVFEHRSEPMGWCHVPQLGPTGKFQKTDRREVEERELLSESEPAT
ncbi:hypothetical protein KI387_015442, partial [Taxus chinensis]